MMLDTRYDTKAEAAFSNDFVPRLVQMGVSVSDICHDESRNLLTLTLTLPEDSGVELRGHVTALLAEFEEGLFLAIVTEPVFRYVTDV